MSFPPSRVGVGRRGSTRRARRPRAARDRRARGALGAAHRGPSRAMSSSTPAKCRNAMVTVRCSGGLRPGLDVRCAPAVDRNAGELACRRRVGRPRRRSRVRSPRGSRASSRPGPHGGTEAARRQLPRGRRADEDLTRPAPPSQARERRRRRGPGDQQLAVRGPDDEERGTAPLWTPTDIRSCTAARAGLDRADLARALRRIRTAARAARARHGRRRRRAAAARRRRTSGARRRWHRRPRAATRSTSDGVGELLGALRPIWARRSDSS